MSQWTYSKTREGNRYFHRMYGLISSVIRPESQNNPTSEYIICMPRTVLEYPSWLFELGLFLYLPILPFFFFFFTFEVVFIWFLFTANIQDYILLGLHTFSLVFRAEIAQGQVYLLLSVQTHTFSSHRCLNTMTMCFMVWTL